MPNHKADIHQWTWYQDRKGTKYLCTSAGWAKDDETGEWAPTRITLLEFLTTEPKEIATEKMIKLLETGALVVVKSIY
jgi:hypothetical protein